MMTGFTRYARTAAAMLAAAALATACGSNPGHPTASQASASHAAAASSAAATASAPPSPTPASTNAAVTSCASSVLKAKVDVSGGGATAGSTYVPINFTNTSASPCTLYGYPGVSFVTSPSGSQLGRAAARDSADAAATVTLAPGGVAHATLRVVVAGNYSTSACTPVTAHWLKIYPPNQFTAVYARYTVQACSARLPRKLGSQLDVYVVRPGAGQAGQGP